MWYSSYDDRPSRLFDGLEHIRLTIHVIGGRKGDGHLFSTRYNKWSSVERPLLFQQLAVVPGASVLGRDTLPKFSSLIELRLVDRLLAEKRRLAEFYAKQGQHVIYYSRKVGYFLQVLDFEPRVFDGKGHRRPPSEFKELRFSTEVNAKLALCCLNSNLFYWFITVFSDCRHVNKREVDVFPIDLQRLRNNNVCRRLVQLAKELMDDLEAHSVERTMAFAHDTLRVQCIMPKASKELLDKIDVALGQHYGFTEEETDFVVSYDAKYRLGQDLEEDE